MVIYDVQIINNINIYLPIFAQLQAQHSAQISQFSNLMQVLLPYSSQLIFAISIKIRHQIKIKIKIKQWGIQHFLPLWYMLVFSPHNFSCTPFAHWIERVLLLSDCRLGINRNSFHAYYEINYCLLFTEVFHVLLSQGQNCTHCCLRKFFSLINISLIYLQLTMIINNHSQHYKQTDIPLIIKYNNNYFNSPNHIFIIGYYSIEILQFFYFQNAFFQKMKKFHLFHIDFCNYSQEIQWLAYIYFMFGNKMWYNKLTHAQILNNSCILHLSISIHNIYYHPQAVQTVPSRHNIALNPIALTMQNPTQPSEDQKIQQPIVSPIKSTVIESQIMTENKSDLNQLDGNNNSDHCTGIRSHGNYSCQSKICQLFCKCCQKCSRISKFKLSFISEIVRTGVYLLVAFGIFIAFERTSHISLREETFFSSQQVVYPSQIRGLFPPIQGSATKLLGKWRVSFTNSLELPLETQIYNNYTLQFRGNDNLRIKRVGCFGDLTMNWQLFHHNIYIKQRPSKEQDPDSEIDKQMIIEPDAEDVRCIKGIEGIPVNDTQGNTGESKADTRKQELGNFISHLVDASVWTIFQDRLYVLVQKWDQGINIQSILLLERD